MFYHLTQNQETAFNIYENGLKRIQSNLGTKDANQILVDVLGNNNPVVKVRQNPIYLYFDEKLKSILEQIDRSVYVFFVDEKGLDFNKLYVLDQFYLNRVVEKEVTAQQDINDCISKYSKTLKTVKEYGESGLEYKYPEFLYLGDIPTEFVKLVRSPI
ncbi:hypothetical protein [Mesobacillus jeotgali]|uniref:hypothetical protein n=1 Tax=Mesobacillus jeotgali TaxID=129985 RepID=UPI000C86162A|nr:hypothetical protein [Mesobacillus jeotgali]